ncbi:MAG: DEAD/DEAH box helicase [Deltaproteobacteria bacterium]|nr:DEAD/DEAH box helicase [Deltaproteobacteria bacterium]
MSFQSLGLSKPLLRAVAERGYSEPTAVQRTVIPEVLQARDVLAKASTGSGKTAAFVLPILELLSRRELVVPRRVHALILVPTRELAKQTTDSIAAFRSYLRQRPKTVVILGGVSINPQMMELRGGADIVVATPGRLLDLVDKNAISLGSVAQLVLDEADRLLDTGFADELARIVALLPVERQTLLFSATFSGAVMRLAGQLLRTPFEADVTDAPTEVPAIQQRAIEVDAPRRTQLLRKLLEEHAWERVLVFVATTHAAEHVSAKLCSAGVNAVALHGKLSQGARTRALDMFRASNVHVLVATDLAARGLDITGLPAVVNYDLPRSPTDYVHRIGRTGRAGESGVAISFITADMRDHFALIERTHRHYIVRERIAGFEPVEVARPASTAGGVKGARKSKKDKLREAASREPKG